MSAKKKKKIAAYRNDLVRPSGLYVAMVHVRGPAVIVHRSQRLPLCAQWGPWKLRFTAAEKKKNKTFKVTKNSKRE